jgi:hypothetical protein
MPKYMYKSGSKLIIFLGKTVSNVFWKIFCLSYLLLIRNLMDKKYVFKKKQLSLRKNYE